METAQSKQPLIIYVALGYAALRTVYEALFNLPESTSIYYLIGLTIGLVGLKLWHDKTDDSQSELKSTIQTIGLAIIVIALAADAARFMILQM